MPVKKLAPLTFEDLLLIDDNFAKPGTLAWLLRDHRALLFPAWVADSTPMCCFGAVLDTVRLLGEGLRSLGKPWARARGVALKDVALEWEEALLLAKSTKGYFEGTDWADAAARSAELFTLVGNLVRVVEEDLEPAKGGGLQVAERGQGASTVRRSRRT